MVFVVFDGISVMCPCPIVCLSAVCWGRDRMIYCIVHNVWLLLLALSSLPIVSSCRFFG